MFISICHDVSSHYRDMDTTEKFSTKMNKDVLARLRDYAQASDRSISVIVSEAVAAYLGRIEVHPAFKSAVEDVIRENEELLRELAR
jgi:predicted transcriptional regulator